MFRHGSLWAWLVLLALVAVTPLLSLLAYTTYRGWNERLQHAEAIALTSAQFQAKRVNEQLRATGDLLKTVGVLLSTDPADVAVNDRLLQTVKATLPPYYGGLAAVDPQGRNIGFGVPAEAAARQRSVADRAYFQAALRTPQTVIGEPVISRSTGAKVIPIARATFGPDGEVRAVVLAALDLGRLQELLAPNELPPESVITVITADGVVLARSLNPEAWVGQNIRDTPSVQDVLQQQQGVRIHTAADGVERVAAFTMLEEAPWLIYVGIPEQVVFQPLRAALLRDSLLGLLSLLLTLVLATLVASRIAHPLARLAEDAVALGAGDLRRRTGVRAGGEIGMLARSFNQMADALDQDLAERERAEEALRTSEALLNAVLDALPVGVVIADATGGIVRTNAAHDAIWGVAPETTSWEQYDAWAGYWPATGERIKADEWAMARALRAGEVVTGELVAYEPFGSERRRFYMNNAAPVRNASGAIIAGVVAELDVTESRRLYEEEQRARAAAEQAVRLRDQFLSIASHELRTPLTLVMAHVQAFQRRALREGNLSERDQRSLQQILTAARRLERMIGAMLDVSRIDQGRLRLERAPLDLAALAREVVAGLEGTSPQHQVAVTGEAAGLWVLGDGLRLEQVLQNLLGNAIKYSPDGGPISVTLAAGAATVQLTVRDTGIGIPAQDVPHIFQRFYRAGNVSADTITGVGIGLFVVQEIVTLHGGTVTVTSEEGEGSSFTVTLPRIENP
jgi:signal transduction histidine kinase